MGRTLTRAMIPRPIAVEAERNGKRNLDQIPIAPSLKVELGTRREMGDGSCILPIFSQKRVFEDLISEIACLFR